MKYYDPMYSEDSPEAQENEERERLMIVLFTPLACGAAVRRIFRQSFDRISYILSSKGHQTPKD